MEASDERKPLVEGRSPPPKEERKHRLNSQPITQKWPVGEHKAVGRFRLCKSKSAIENLLKKHHETEIFGEILSRYTVSNHVGERNLSVSTIELITVDRDASKEEVAKITLNLPSIMTTLKDWKDDPETLRKSLMSRKKDNRLLALMGLKTSDLMEERVEEEI